MHALSHSVRYFEEVAAQKSIRRAAERLNARADVFDYIERFYNPMRRHSTLGHVSPVRFEQAQKA